MKTLLLIFAFSLLSPIAKAQAFWSMESHGAGVYKVPMPLKIGQQGEAEGSGRRGAFNIRKYYTIMYKTKLTLIRPGGLIG